MPDVIKKLWMSCMCNDLILCLHFCPVNLIWALALLLLWETLETFPTVSLPPSLLPVFFLPETAQQDPCLRTQPRLTSARGFYSKKQQLGQCFSLDLLGNLAVDGKRRRGGTVWADGLGRWDSAEYPNPSPHPSPPDGRYFLFPDDVTVLWQINLLHK